MQYAIYNGTRRITVLAETGLHARPASQIVEAANSFQSCITLSKNNKTVNGKSIMGILSLTVATGDEILLAADGIDEDVALEKLAAVITTELG
jgi:phosphotransferase system HPr (HPr) family protein